MEDLEIKTKKDIEITRKALLKVKLIVPKRSHLHKIGEDFLSMARAYFRDAVHFFENGNIVNAFGCVNYAHGWLDAGARLGVFNVGEDDTLFTLAE